MEVFERIENAGGRILIVGGAVRDRYLGLEPKDIDIEVYGLSYEEILGALKGLKCDTVGKSFGIIKCGGFDLSIPRTENKIGVGHKNFEIELNHKLTPKEAAMRRDFTMNSMYETLRGEIIDEFGGREDLNNGVLRHTSSAFAEDPLRVLRGMQFCGRFNLVGHPSTLELCRSMIGEFESLSKDRLWAEWAKLFSSNKPSMGLKFLKDSGWIKCFPALDLEIPQDPIWHPEGNVWVHTLYVCDEAARIAREKNLDPIILVGAALLHDVGKAITTFEKNGRWVSPGHAEKGVSIARDFLESIKCPNNIANQICILVKEHMAHINLTEKSVKRLKIRLGPVSMNMWGAIVESDHSGRPPLPKANPSEKWVEIGNSLSVEPLLKGRHLISLGVSPGPEMGKILNEAYEIQLEKCWDFDMLMNWAKNRR